MPDESALEKLKRKIEEAKRGAVPSPANENKSYSLGGKFFNVGVELVAGVFVGVGLGLLIDWLFGISPWGLITFFILGSGAGLRNVYRAVTKQETKNPKDDPHV